VPSSLLLGRATESHLHVLNLLDCREVVGVGERLLHESEEGEGGTEFNEGADACGDGGGGDCITEGVGTAEEEKGSEVYGDAESNGEGGHGVADACEVLVGNVVGVAGGGELQGRSEGADGDSPSCEAAGGAARLTLLPCFHVEGVVGVGGEVGGEVLLAELSEGSEESGVHEGLRWGGSPPPKRGRATPVKA